MKMLVIGSTYESEVKYKQMKAVYDSCIAADIDVPSDVEEFFDGNEPDDDTMNIDLEKLKDFDGLTTHDDGFTIDIKKLNEYNDSYNPEIHFVRFKISDF